MEINKKNINKGYDKMLDKKMIINTLNKYNFDKSKYIVISGAAMVLLGIKEETNDIDIATTKEYYDYLLNNYNCKLEFTNMNNINVYYIDNIINFSYDNYSNDYIIKNGIHTQTINDLLAFKRAYGRDKDKKDIELILKFQSKNTKWKFCIFLFKMIEF